MNPYSRLAASLMILAAIVAFFLPTTGSQAFAQDSIIMVPEGGKLEALDEEGNLIGPCPLKNTVVNVEVSGFFSRVNIKQTYQNPYKKKIEAVYTFPMSHRAAVDSLTMTVGDRVVVGEVKEREQARRIYEAAREQGYVASLLEQERPNIFTQSIANIEPEAQVIVEISYVEVLQSKDGQYTFDFPMVVGPRYIPGASMTSPAIVPAELAVRHGVILLGPAKFTLGAAGDVTELGSLQTGKLTALLSSAQPIKYPGDTWWGKGDPTGGAGQMKLWYRFEARYSDESKEFGELYTDGTGQINGRWFFTDPANITEMGTGFSQDTNQVPDASRITPEPVRPGERAGHNISVSVTIDTGGPGIVDLKSSLHELTGDDFLDDFEAPSKVTVALADAKEIPNRDFVLSWRTSAETITEAKLTHAGKNGGFFTLILQPPDRVEVADIPPRELIFVMDISGSMRGYPIEKSKEVIAKAIDAMRPRDTFNVITFANGTDILWSDPKPATPGNRAAAQTFINSQRGGGGTEMMTAINAALVQTVGERPTPLTPRQLADLPADGRGVTILVACGKIRAMLPAEAEGHELTVTIHLCNGGTILVRGLQMHFHVRPSWQLVTGRWVTQGGRRVFTVDEVRHVEEAAPAKPMRIVLFLTDGYVGNNMAIIDAVKKNAHTTRVFSFGIGNSVNRYLLQGMANAGRGEAEFVLLESDSDAAVERFTKRVETPVLTDITLTFSDGLEVMDVIPPLDAVPDLFDVQPLVIHGRYSKAGTGTLTIAGKTGAGPYERVLDLEFAEDQPEHDVIATLWARARVEQIMSQDLAAAQQNNFPADLKQQVVALGEEFQIMTQYTSFVAVEKSRLTIDGQPVLVAVPIEMPSGVSYEGIFGGLIEEAVGREIFLGAKLGLMGVDTLGSAEGDANDDDEPLRSIVDVLKMRVQSRGVLDIDTAGEKLKDALHDKSAPLTVPQRIDLTRKLGQTLEETVKLNLGAIRHRAAPPGPPRAEPRYLSTTATRTAAGEQLGRGKVPARRMSPGRRSRGRDVKLEVDSALQQARESTSGVRAAPGAGGFGTGGGGGRKSGQKSPQGFGLWSIHTPGVPGYQSETPLLSDIPLLGDAFRYEASDEQVGSFYADIPRDDRADKDSVDRRAAVAGKASLFDELRRVVEANKADDEPADAGAPAPATELTNEVAEAVTSKETVELPLLTHLFMRAGRPLLTNEVAIIIGQLVEADQIETAKQLTDELIIYLPEYELGVKMREAFTNDELDEETRSTAVIELALKAQAQLEAVMFRAWAEARLRNVLEASLYQSLVDASAAETRAEDRAALTDDTLLVSVLATSVDDDVLSALKEAGLIVKAKPTSGSFVVGETSREKLVDLALLQAVRRIEPAQLTATRN